MSALTRLHGTPPTPVFPKRRRKREVQNGLSKQLPIVLSQHRELGLGRAPCCGQLPDAVVSERVPASSEEELGAWPDSPRLCRPRALLLLPGEQVESERNTLSRPRPQRCFGHLPPSGTSAHQRVTPSGLEGVNSYCCPATMFGYTNGGRLPPAQAGHRLQGSNRCGRE